MQRKTIDKVPQSQDEILKLAEAGLWNQIEPTSDPILNEAIRLKKIGLVEPAIKKNYDLALLMAGFKEKDEDVNIKYNFALLCLPHVKNIHTPAQKDAGKTILHYAATNGWIDLVEQLVEKYNAYVNIADNRRWGPLGYACQNNYIGIAHYLIRNGAYFAAYQKTPFELFTNEKALKSFSQSFSESQAAHNSKRSLPSLSSEQRWIVDTGKSCAYDASLEDKLKMFLKLTQSIVPFYSAEALIQLEKMTNCQIPQQISELLKNKTESQSTIFIKKEHLKILKGALGVADELVFLDKRFGCEFLVEKKDLYKAKAASWTSVQLEKIQYCQPYVIFQNNEIIISNPRTDLTRIINLLIKFDFSTEQKQILSDLEKMLGCKFEVEALDKFNYKLISQPIDWTFEKMKIVDAGYCKKNDNTIEINHLYLGKFHENAKRVMQELHEENKSPEPIQCAYQ